MVRKPYKPLYPLSEDTFYPGNQRPDVDLSVFKIEKGVKQMTKKGPPTVGYWVRKKNKNARPKNISRSAARKRAIKAWKSKKSNPRAIKIATIKAQRTKKANLKFKGIKK